MDINLQLLTLSDINQLLDFELENREWFEKFVPPRTEGFYSLTGVRCQIDEFIELYENKTMLPMLIKTSQSHICGRINLSMDEPDALAGTVGYRVGEVYTRKGVATSALRLLQEYVIEHTELTTLKAIALTSNVGSCNTLKNNGFKRVDYIKNYTLLNSRHENAYEYVWMK